MIKKRIPLASLQKALYQALTTYQPVPVYNSIAEDAVYPLIKIGAFTCKPNSGKDTDMSNVSTQIHIYTQYEGALQANEIANDVIEIIGYQKFDLSADGFSTVRQDYDFFESFEDENGYFSIVTFVATIQNTGMGA